jgi:hypothetical protein
LQRHGDCAGGAGAGDRAGAGGCQEEKRSRHASWPKRGDGGNRWDLLRFKVIEWDLL